jgi:hypothetical protein
MSEKTKNSKSKNIVRAMNTSRGRYFSIQTKQGDLINGRFVRETPCYVYVEDRNSFHLTKRDNVLKIHKDSLKSFRMGETQI